MAERDNKLNSQRSLAERGFDWITDKLGITSAPTYTDGYGIKRNAQADIGESARGQELSRMSNTAKQVGLLTFGAMAPVSKINAIKLLNKGVGTVATADFLTSDRLASLPKDINEGNYARAAVTTGEGLLTSLMVGSAIKNSKLSKQIFDRLAKSGIGSNDNMILHRAVVIPKGNPKPSLDYKRTGDNVYNIPDNQKYVGSYDTAVSSVPNSKLKQTIVEHYKVPTKKVNILEQDIYPDGEIDLVAGLSNKIYPTAYSTANTGIIPKDIPMYNWETMSNKLRTIAGGTLGVGSTGALVFSELKK